MPIRANTRTNGQK
ncbi:hypothetical protein YPPY03_2182, partial [Yersinia pestis PY-03]